MDGKIFATPRGWEDLSGFLKVCEKVDLICDREVVVQYIEHPRIAKDFENYIRSIRRDTRSMKFWKENAMRA